MKTTFRDIHLSHKITFYQAKVTPSPSTPFLREECLMTKLVVKKVKNGSKVLCTSTCGQPPISLQFTGDCHVEYSPMKVAMYIPHNAILFCFIF